MASTPRIDRLEINYAYNSDFSIWQRGVTTPAGFTNLDHNYYIADRWYHRFEAGAGTTNNVTYRVEDAPANTPLRYCARIEPFGGGNAATGVVQNLYRQVLEKSDTRQLIRDGKFTVSFWYKTNMVGEHAAGVDVQGFTGANPAAQGFTVNSADTWEKKVITFDVSNKANNDDGVVADNGAGLLLNIGPQTGGIGFSTWDSGDYFQITGIMLVSGENEAEWKLKGENIGSELLMCQRYFCKGELVNSMQDNALRLNDEMAFFPVTMRGIPTVAISTSASQATGTVSVNDIQVDSFFLRVFPATPTSAHVFWFGNFTADAEL